MTAKESRTERPHWRRIKLFFGFERCNETGARTAATCLNVEDPSMLRATYDLNLTAASRNVLDKLLLAAADDRIAGIKKQLAEAEAIRKKIADAELISGREATAVASLVLPGVGGGEPVTYHFQQHEQILLECLTEEYT